MNDLRLNHSALAVCLQTLNHLLVDIARLTYEQGYEEIVGGYCELKVATLDSGESTSKLVAAKKLRLGSRALEPKRLAFRLARELKVWAGLRHPHILPLLGFYLSNDCKTALLISEYMKYGDLKDFIAKMKPSCNERLSLVRDLTDGLAYLHTQKPPIRHGDLKTGNVLVNSDRRAMLADFGLSKTLDTGPTGFTTGNDARGTVRYSSPEILLQGTAAESLSNDIWSWGCLAMETLTDEIPFAEMKSEPQLIIAIVQGRSPSDASSLSSYAKELRALLVDCWSRQPNKRPTAVDCLRIVECAIPTPEEKTASTAELPSPSLPSPFVPCTEVPARAITNSSFNSPNGSTLSTATRQHNLNQPRHRPSGVTSPRNGALWNQLQQRYATRQLNQNGINMLNQAQVRSQHPNQLTNGNRLLSRTDPSLAVSPSDDTELLESQSSSRLRIPKEAVTPAWSVPPYVLLVDDDLVSRRVFTKFLEASGCTVDVAVDGLDAVSKMESESYDLVLMDIIMPNLDGISATSLIRQFDNSTPIISMTSECKPNDILVYYTNGMNDILPKPFTQKELFAMLEKHLEHLKAATVARAAAEEPSQALSGDWCSSTPSLLDMSLDGMDCLRLLEPIGEIAVADLAGSAEEVLKTAEESKCPHLETV